MAVPVDAILLSREWSKEAASHASGASVTTYSQSRTGGDSEILDLLDLSMLPFILVFPMFNISHIGTSQNRWNASVIFKRV
jgi:hypothetical protein